MHQPVQKVVSPGPINYGSILPDLTITNDKTFFSPKNPPKKSILVREAQIKRVSVAKKNSNQMVPLNGMKTQGLITNYRTT